MEKTLIGLRRKQPCLDFGLLASSPETQYISVVQATQLVGLGHRCSGRWVHAQLLAPAVASLIQEPLYQVGKRVSHSCGGKQRKMWWYLHPPHPSSFPGSYRGGRNLSGGMFPCPHSRGVWLHTWKRVIASPYTFLSPLCLRWSVSVAHPNSLSNCYTENESVSLGLKKCDLVS